jgi:outer membrane protein OmpA-like peptidoglycan-associated protein
VLDHLDPCPGTPSGPHPDPARPGCPDADSDADTVYDAIDVCPQQHHGLHPDPDRPGCPLPDRDNDSVPDATDACPDEPGAPSRDPRRNGCPGLVAIEEGMMRIVRPVFFATNRDTILARSRPVLEALTDAVAATPGIRRIVIEGHTDDVGEAEYNRDLSERRAQSVRTWLVEHGIDASRLETRGFGETCPVVPETTARARASNRRVDFRIVDPSMSPPNPCPPPSAQGTETDTDEEGQ